MNAKHRTNERGFPSLADPGISGPERWNTRIRAEDYIFRGAGAFSGAQEFKHGGLSYRDETMDGLEAHLGEGVPLGRHNSAISRCRFRLAGATGVAARADRDSRESCERRPDPQ